MRREHFRRKVGLEVQSLEDRQLPSGGLGALKGLAGLVGSMQQPSGITINPGGEAAILSALQGGIGSEFVKLIHKELHNQSAVLSGFISGKLNSYSIPGIAVATPSVQPLFTGHFYDQLGPTVAGAVLLKHNVLELGAIMRGPFHDPSTSYYVFGIDRGAGGRLGPIFPSAPGITPDVVLTLAIGPYGSTASGTLTDLTNGTSQTIAPSNISVAGSVVRVYLQASQLPSEGLPISKFRFAFWTQTQQGGDISTVVNFLPSGTMIPIGVEKNVSPTY